MNVFVLCTGRSGSHTFVKACSHMTNYTAGHESRHRFLGQERFQYPENFIEADNRLAWILGRLDDAYGDQAFYVHLLRDRRETAESWNRRWHLKGTIIMAYAQSIIRHKEHGLAVCMDYWDTVNSNIRLFLKDKSKKMEFHLDRAREQYPEFWRRIGAEGDLEAALREWEVMHDASTEKENLKKGPYRKARRIFKKLPKFIREA